MPTWNWFADYTPSPPHQNTQTMDLKQAQLVLERMPFGGIFGELRPDGQEDGKACRRSNISQNLMIWQIWRLLGVASAQGWWHASIWIIEKKSTFQNHFCVSIFFKFLNNFNTNLPFWSIRFHVWPRVKKRQIDCQKILEAFLKLYVWSQYLRF